MPPRGVKKGTKSSSAKKLGIEGRSRRSKAQLQRAVAGVES